MLGSQVKTNSFLRTSTSLGMESNVSKKSAMLMKELQSLEKIKAKQQREIEQLIETELI